MDNKQKVLIVDDEPRNQRIIQETLDDAFDLQFASSGEEAMAILENSAPDLVLLDIMMPGIDGYEVCKRIRGQKHLQLSKVILVSGKAMIDERLKGYSVGADDYMTKPFVPEELLAKVKVFLRLVKIERELTEINIALDAKVQERTQQLIDAQAKLVNSSKMSALGEMAGGIAHEVNTPLTTILLLAEQNLEDLESKKVDVEFITSGFKKVEYAARHIAKIISGMRMISRNGDIDPYTKTELHTIFNDTVLLCGERFRRDAIELQSEIDNVTIECRPSQLAQVVLNLFNNASDAITHCREKWIRIEVRGREEDVEIRIINSGPKIAEDVRSRLFQPFFTTKEVGKGTGLGLNISKNIVEAHHGRIVLDEASPNTCFVITLPRRQPDKKAA
jgi:C4-dicarboxylate-specific signal transduction histidine kinase